MNKLKTFAAAGMVAAALTVSSGAHAQTATAPAPAAPAATAESGYGFDGYRVLAVTAGVIGGAVVATIVTDGIIIPVYAMATGGPGAVGGMGFGAGAAEFGMGGGQMFGSAAHTGSRVFSGAMKVLGAVAGGFYADSWYTGK